MSLKLRISIYLPVRFVCFLFSPVISCFSGVFSRFSRLNVHLSGEHGMFSFSLCSDSNLRPLGITVGPTVLPGCPTPSIQDLYSCGTLVTGTPSQWKSLLSRGWSKMKSKPQRFEASSRSFCRAAWYSSCSCSRSTGPNRFRRVGPFTRVLRIRLRLAIILHCMKQRQDHDELRQWWWPVQSQYGTC